MSEFEAIVREHQAAVCATAYAVLRDRARSEEIAQDAFLLAWRKLPAVQPPPPLPAWICGIARNLARNAARKHREAPMNDHVTPAPEAAATTPLDTALSREHADLANRALATLSDDDRELVVLYYRCDESIAGIAGALGIPQVTARKRLQRTRERLRGALAAVESMLRVTRPGPAFTAACVAALAVGRVPDASAATTTTSTSSASSPAKLAGVAIGGLALVAASALAIRAAVSSSSSSSPPTSTIGTPTSRTRVGSPSTARGAGLIERISADERAALLARVQTKRSTAAPSAGAIAPKVFDFADTNLADTAVPDPIPTGPLGKKTLRYAIALMHPMLLACRADDAARGRLAIKMRLSGEETGTVVESVEVIGDSPLAEDAELGECVRTTLETLELPPMADLAPWDVFYTFIF